MILGVIIGFVGWLGLSMFVHEVLHLETARRLGYSAKISFFKYGVNTIVKPFPTKSHDLKILGAGFIGGLLMVWVYILGSSSEIIGFTMLGLYLFFTRDDAKQIMFINRSLSK